MLFPSLSTVVTAVVALASSASALPHPPRSTDLNRLASMMPLNTLPAPTGLQLKYVLLGIGTQNYTCATSISTDAPGTTGALAKLYDLGSRLNNDPMAQWKLGSISGLALSLSQYGAWPLETYLNSQGYSRWLGNHFFTQTTPTFSLNQVKSNPFPLAYVLKKAAVDAPKTACPGTKNEGAVQWLKLADDNNLSQGGINTVYRIETAGGNKPAQCQGQQTAFQVPYAAQYWVFGPPS